MADLEELFEDDALPGWTQNGVEIGTSAVVSFQGAKSLETDYAAEDENYIYRTDVSDVAQLDQGYYVSFALYIPDWADHWDGGSGYGGYLVGIDPLSDFGYPAHDALYFYPTSATTGSVVMDPQNGSHALEADIPDGEWVTIRAYWKTSSVAYPSGTDGEGYLWVNDVAVGALITGARTYSTGLWIGNYYGDYGGLSSPTTYYIDELRYSSVADPGEPLGGGGAAELYEVTGNGTSIFVSSGNFKDYQETQLVADTAVPVYPVTTVTGPVSGFGMTNDDLGLTLQTYFTVPDGDTLVIDHATRTMTLEGVIVFGYTGSFFPVDSSQHITVNAGVYGAGFTAEMDIGNAEGRKTRQQYGGGVIDMGGRALVNPRARVGSGAMVLVASAAAVDREVAERGAGVMPHVGSGPLGHVYPKAGLGAKPHTALGGDATTHTETGNGASPRTASGASVFEDN
jgi:hypothetical protein